MTRQRTSTEKQKRQALWIAHNKGGFLSQQGARINNKPQGRGAWRAMADACERDSCLPPAGRRRSFRASRAAPVCATAPQAPRMPRLQTLTRNDLMPARLAVALVHKYKHLHYPETKQSRHTQFHLRHSPSPRHTAQTKQNIWPPRASAQTHLPGLPTDSRRHRQPPYSRTTQSRMEVT